MPKYLRIAVTVLSLTACVLLIALWVRSYWWADMVTGRLLFLQAITILSSNGHMNFFHLTDQQYRWEHHRTFPEVAETWERACDGYTFGFAVDLYDRNRNMAAIAFPHWFLLLGSALLAAFPFIPSRFSLRTLRIATTLVAAMLGLIVAAQ